MLISYCGNILETNVDAYLVAITGDAEGYFGSVEEIFVIPKYLTSQEYILISKNTV
jgi:hypothetical protein